MTTKSLRLAGATLFLGTITLLRAAVAPAENLLPADTLAFFTVPDCNTLRAAAKVSPQMMFWNDTAMKPFRDKFMGRLTEQFLTPLEKDLGIKADDFLSLLQGQFTVGVTINGSKGNDDVPPGIVILLDTKTQTETLKTNLASLTKKWTAAGRALRTEKFSGLAFTVVPLSSNDLAAIFPSRSAAAKPGEIFFAQHQSLLVAANSATICQSVATRLTGGSAPVIADDAVLASDKLSQFRDDPLYYGWFNGAKFFNLLASGNKEAQSDDSAMPLPRLDAAKIISATGLGSLKSASFAVREQPDGSLVTLHLTAPEAARSGLLNILALPAKNADIPPFVSADTVKFTRLRLDGKQVWAEVQKSLGNISPDYLARFNSVIDVANSLAQMKNPAFDLRTYLFENLGDDLIVCQKAAIGQTIQAIANPPTLYLLNVADAAKGIDAIKTLAGMSAPQESASATPREFLGYKIHSIALRPTRVPGSTATQPNSLYLASAGGYLAISKDTSTLEEYLRSAEAKSKSLREQPGIAEAVSRVGTKGGLLTYENQRETMRTAFKLLKNSSTGALPMLPPNLRSWADFTLLPEYDAVAKYFYLSVAGASTDASGMTLKVFAPRPPQLK